jgi:hypothetical protein
MSDADTVKSIITNIKTLLTAGGYQLEDDGIGADKQLLSAAAARVDYLGESFDDAFGQRSSFAEVLFSITFSFNGVNLTTRRTKFADLIHFIRDGFTVDTLNVGDLVLTKLVSAVRTESVDTSYERPFAEVVYQIRIRYREDDTYGD